MQRCFRFTFAAVLILIISAAAGAQSSWAGTYEFDEDGGKTVGGTAIFVSHELDIIETDDGFAAVLKSSGYQTSTDLQCTTKADGSRLLIYFDEYGEDNIFENYKKGELLLTLERKSDNKAETILTYWGAFKPIAKKNDKSGRVYFVKVENIKIDDK